MPVGLNPPENLLPIAGVRLATAESGMRYADRPDLLLISLTEQAVTTAVFTRNAFCAAPVLVARRHLEEASPRFLLINAGNANAGTGKQGEKAALASCAALAETAGANINEILPFSTGVIGVALDASKIEQHSEPLFRTLEPDYWHEAAAAIMTTDTIAKGYSDQFELQGQLITITGICKGSGMICPDMATLLTFIATDAEIDQSDLQACLDRGVRDSFNSITVDGDTSTNDACTLSATGAAGARLQGADLQVFTERLSALMQRLAQAVIRDAEGATKFIEIQVAGAASRDDARDVAYTIAHSPLVKTAFFASDANWGRILAAIGRTKHAVFDFTKVAIKLNALPLVDNGELVSSYTEAAGAKEMAKAEIKIMVNLNHGNASATIWTSDLSHEYVSINADYRS